MTTEPLPRWRIGLIKGTPAKTLGHVYAPTESAALRQAIKEIKIAPALRNRLVADVTSELRLADDAGWLPEYLSRSVLN